MRIGQGDLKLGQMGQRGQGLQVDECRWRRRVKLLIDELRDAIGGPAAQPVGPLQCGGEHGGRVARVELQDAHELAARLLGPGQLERREVGAVDRRPLRGPLLDGARQVERAGLVLQQG